jgi:hypothetical protein
VAAEAEVIAALFRRRCRAVAMNDRRIETAVLMKLPTGCGFRWELAGTAMMV